jgi:hypothetical protein
MFRFFRNLLALLRKPTAPRRSEMEQMREALKPASDKPAVRHPIRNR